ncbi:MAG: GNAT family N-acetyltransferase [Ferrimicrobium sp.]
MGTAGVVGLSADEGLPTLTGSLSPGSVETMDLGSLGFRTDIMVRRLAGSEIFDRGDYLVVKTPANPGFYWGNFVLVPRLIGAEDAVRWLDVFSAEFPEASHVAIGLDCVDQEIGDMAEMLGIGVIGEVSIVLHTSSLVEPAYSHPSAVIRSLEGDDDWENAITLSRVVASDSGLESALHRQFLARRTDEARRLVETGHAVFLGAFVQGVLLATLGLVVDDVGLARYQNVETHPSHRRQGLAGALVHGAGVYGLRHLGARSLVIVADPNGPAVDLYRSLGFVDLEWQVAMVRAAPM